MFELQLQLVVVFTAKSFGQQAWEFLSPYLFGLLGRLYELRKVRQLLIDQMQNETGDDDTDDGQLRETPDLRLSSRQREINEPQSLSQSGLAVEDEGDGAGTPRQMQIKLSALEREASKPAYGGTRMEYEKLVVQFGYVTMFGTGA